eukprot:COSAG01_NODE_65817_length_272_cov_0.601156_1_plen_58_part_10
MSKRRPWRPYPVTCGVCLCALLWQPELYDLFRLLFGERAVTLDYKWLRAVSPPPPGQV